MCSGEIVCRTGNMVHKFLLGGTWCLHRNHLLCEVTVFNELAALTTVHFAHAGVLEEYCRTPAQANCKSMCELVSPLFPSVTYMYCFLY